MKIIVSPAKSLEEDRALPTSRHTQPRFLEEAVTLNRKLARMSKNEIAKLMAISDKLAALNYDRYQSFDEKNSENARPAVFLYNGDVAKGLDAYTLPEDKWDALQEKLRIISGLYGLLRPFDLIQPYRLEMKIKLKGHRYKNLYEFWIEKLTAALNEEMANDELLLNLASREYAKAVNQKKLQGKVISPVFKDYKNGRLKIISFYAKKARGAMVRYILDKGVNTVEGVKNFDYMRYRFSEKYTEQKENPVFVR